MATYPLGIASLITTITHCHWELTTLLLGLADSDSIFDFSLVVAIKIKLIRYLATSSEQVRGNSEEELMKM